jgi:hypothetical protein
LSVLIKSSHLKNTPEKLNYRLHENIIFASQIKEKNRKKYNKKTIKLVMCICSYFNTIYTKNKIINGVSEFQFIIF